MMRTPQLALVDLGPARRRRIAARVGSAAFESSSVVAVDLFAGGGGASEGIRLATGRAPVVAVNHDPAAIRMHASNHPGTLHLCEDVFDVRPFRPGGALDLLWASPDCTHFSRAKGGRPRRKDIRALAWVVVRWAKLARPRVIGLENVQEFLTWGPLDGEGRPIASRAGETFRGFVRALEALGYVVEWRTLVAADYGAPTSRKRLFLVARCDGEPIVWPAPTHGADRAPHRTAAECIQWDVPTTSIFGRARPLVEATQRRIAEGIRRFVLDAQKPFLVLLTHGGRLHDLERPLPTVTAAHRGELALVAAHLTKFYGTSTGAPVVEPVPTITGAGQHLGLVAAHLIQAGYGERPGQRPRALDLDAPLGTVVAGGNKHALIVAALTRYNGTGGAEDPALPLPTCTTRDRFAVAAAWLAKHNGGTTGQGLDEPMHTITGTDTKALGTAEVGCDPPPHLIVWFARHLPGREPFVTIDSERFAIVDIGMRMLDPRELARAHGFSDDYVLEGSRTEQVARIGNSVPPRVVAAVVEAQFGLSAPDNGHA